MKKRMLCMIALCLLLAGCGGAGEETKEPDAGNAGAEIVDPVPSAPAEPEEPGVTVYPLPDTTMENLTDATLAISLEKGDAYVDDTGKMQMDVKIYTYDIYDMKDISQLKEGDVIVTHAGQVEVRSLERNGTDTLFINGGLENGGFDLFSAGGGILYEVGYNDAMNWYEVGEATIRVSADFMGQDASDPDGEPVILYPGDFLVDAISDYNFTPYNTTIRVEAGQIVELNRVYVP